MKILCFIFFCFFIFKNQTIASTSILFLGDSLSEGQGVGEEDSFPRIVEKKLREKKYSLNVINGGVSGATSSSGLVRLKWHLKKKIDILVLELGANDGLRGLPLKETQKNLEEIVDYAKNKKMKVLLLGLLMPPNYGEKYTKDFSKMYKEIARKKNLPFLPFILEGVAGNAHLNLADGIHPNPAGHEIVARKVSSFIEKNL